MKTPKVPKRIPTTTIGGEASHSIATPATKPALVREHLQEARTVELEKMRMDMESQESTCREGGKSMGRPGESIGFVSCHRASFCTKMM